MTLPANWASGQQFTAAAENAVEAAIDNLQLAPVAVQTANYTASPGQLVPVDATSAPVTVTLPSAPVDQALIVVKKVDPGTNAVTVAASGSDHFNRSNDGISLSLSLQYQAVKLLYSLSQSVWYVVSTDVPLSGMDARYVLATAPTSTPTASTVAQWDASKNLSANALLPAQTSTATAAGTTTLTIASAQTQIFTGTSTQTVALPTTGVNAGYSYTIVNQSTGAVTVQSSGLNTITTLLGGQTATFVAKTNTPTTAAQWFVAFNSSTPIPPANLPNGITNFNTTAYSAQPTAGTAVYIPGSALALPSTLLTGVTANKTTFIWDVAINKNANGTGTFSLVFYRGPNGTTADTVDATVSLGTQTAVADNMTVEVQVTFTGASAYYYSIVTTHVAPSATGFGMTTGSSSHFSGTVGSASLAAGQIMGLGFISGTGGTQPTITIAQVQSTTYNLD